MRKDEIIDLLTEYSTNERLSKLVMKNEEYKSALKYEEEQYGIFDKTLTDEQKVLLNSFAEANAKTTAIYLKFTYQQGLKDMFNLNESLQNDVKLVYEIMEKKLKVN